MFLSCFEIVFFRLGPAKEKLSCNKKTYILVVVPFYYTNSGYKHVF